MEETGENPTQMRALVINLDRRPDRWQRCEAMLRAELPWLRFERFSASCGKEGVIPDQHIAKTWNTKHNALYGSYEDIFDKDGRLLYAKADFRDPGVEYFLSEGERGCAYSHYRAWERAALQGGPMLILEDDVRLVFNRAGGLATSSGRALTDRLQAGMHHAHERHADLLYLGWSGFRDGNFRYLRGEDERDNPFIRRVEYVWTTVAYVLWPRGARKLLKAAQPMDQPVDNFMAWEAREGRLNSFVLLDSGDTDSDWSGGIVQQVDFANDTDIKKSDGGDQGDDATEYLVTSTARETRPKVLADGLSAEVTQAAAWGGR